MINLDEDVVAICLVWKQVFIIKFPTLIWLTAAAAAAAAAAWRN